jgi:hypothetical protein
MKDRFVDSFVIFNTRLCIAVLCVHLHDVIKCMFLFLSQSFLTIIESINIVNDRQQ